MRDRQYFIRRMLEMAAGPQWLTWRRMHDTVSRDDRIRAKSAFHELTRSGQVHSSKHGRQTWWFTCPKRAASFKPPDFNARPAPAPRPQPAPPRAPGEPKHTTCPGWTHDRRYHIEPGATVPALYSGLPMGRYPGETP